MNRFTILTAIFIGFTFSCSSQKMVDVQPDLLDRLKEEVESYNISEDSSGFTINISDITTFEWEEMHIFGPYTPIDEIQKSLGFDWSRAQNLIYQISDTHSLLVFTSNESVVKYLKYPNGYGDFKEIDNTGPYKKTDASFILKKEIYGGQPWLFFYR